jgi:hypothetical protein
MALQITSTITSYEGIEIPSSYGRVSVSDGQYGTSLIAGLNIYVSQTAFENGASSIAVIDNTKPEGSAPMFVNWQLPYDRTIEGTDILTLAHEYIQAELASKGISSTIEL